MERIRQTTQSELAAHTVKIIRAEIENLSYAGRPIAISPDNLEALANEYDSAIAFRATIAAKSFTPDWSLLEATQDSLREHMAIAKAAQESERAFREQVAVALEELRGLINLEFIGDEFSDYNEGLRDALRHVDATIAALGLGGTEEAKCQHSAKLTDE